jgi:hypothetical protein
MLHDEGYPLGSSLVLRDDALSSILYTAQDLYALTLLKQGTSDIV